MEVTLKKNGWYNRLQSFVLGKSKPELYSLCPFFWLTIFCIFALPFAAIIKSVIYVYDNIDSYIKKQYKEQLNTFLNSLTNEDAVRLSHNERIKRRIPLFLIATSRSDLYYTWLDLMHKNGKWNLNNYNKAVDRYFDIRDERINKKKKNKNSTIKLDKFLMPIIKWTKITFNILFTLLLMIGISFLINAIVVYFNPIVTFNVLKIILISAVIILLLVGSGYLLYILFAYFLENLNISVNTKRFNYILKPFVFIKNIFISFFSLFIEYFKATKNNYCPAINWEEE